MSRERQRTVVLLGSDPEYLVNFRAPLIKELLERKYRVITASWAAGEAVKQQLKTLGVAEHLELPIKQGSLNPFAEFRLFLSICSALGARKPRAVIAYTAKPVVNGMLAAWVMRVPLKVALVEGLGYAFIPGPGAKRKLALALLSAAYKLAINCADKVLVLNSADRASISKITGRNRENIFLLPGIGVPASYFNAPPVPTGPPKFLYIGRILIDKGVRELLLAASQLRRQSCAFTLDIIGAHDNNPSALRKAEFETLIDEAGAKWHGPQADVAPFLHRASMLVLPSYREGFPRVVMEAMAAGRGVITTDVPGCADAVEHGQEGLLVRARDPQHLAEAMLRLVSEPTLSAEFGLRARLRAEKDFVAEDRARDLLDLVGL